MAPEPETGGKAWGHLLSRAASELRWQDPENAMRDARRLLAHALGTSTDRLALFLQEHPGEDETARFLQLVEKRIARQPVSQIVSGREFFGRKFYVDGNVLDPRPETEHLVELALTRLFRRVLDLGTGSGCILLTLLKERPTTSGVGVDISPDALNVALLNAATLDVAPKWVDFRTSDWFENVAGQFDLIVANPPYVTAAEYVDLEPEVHDWEPKIALTPGGDGLDSYRAIAAGVMAHLAPSGRLIVEIGPTQASAVQALFAAAGLENLRIHPDLDGRDRVLSGTHPANV